MASLTVEDLNVSYGRHHALRNVSLSVEEGELIAVIGPNGAGKTSFIRALCGRVPSKGRIIVSGTEIKRGEDRRRTIGLVPQDIGLYEHLTGKENLSVIARLMGVPRKERRAQVAWALDSVGMTEKARVKVRDMSGGMKRRINVAAAIMHRPEVLIFDEPTAGVDVPARDVVHRLARDMAERRIAVLLVTHELEEAEALCDKVLLLNDGAVAAFEPPATLLSRVFGGQREVVIRYAQPPGEVQRAAMAPFGFTPGHLPTVFTAMTEASEVSFVSAFMTALRGGSASIREVSVRRPGLTALLHRIEDAKSDETERAA